LSKKIINQIFVSDAYQNPKNVELDTDSVFSVGIRLVFLGVYQTNTGGKLGW
jgi:hypothetical protein